MTNDSKNNAYVIIDNRVIMCTSNWGGVYDFRLFQNLDELKRYFESVNINKNNYEIY